MCGTPLGARTGDQHVVPCATVQRKQAQRVAQERQATVDLVRHRRVIAVECGQGAEPLVQRASRWGASKRSPLSAMA